MKTQLQNKRASKLFFFAWLFLLAAISLCYLPGLNGGFVFDDEVNILQNPSLRLRTLSFPELCSAAFSGDAGPLGRPIALLSFALNLYATGADPFFFKLTNLLIHLGNTIFVGVLAGALCSRLDTRLSKVNFAQGANAWSGWLVAALWGLHPLNLSSVLYVVQRMTSLSAMFGLLALVVYVRSRATHDHGGRPGTFGRSLLSAFAVLVLLVASVFSKESGLLFIPLLLWIEYIVFGFRLRGNVIRVGPWSLRTIVNTALALAALVVVFYAMPRMLTPGAFANRDFTLVERALTESRVLFYYLRLLLLPRSTELSLYHDDFQISTGLLEPVTTLLSIAGLVAISWVAILLRNRLPVLLFAWGWFLIAHALESTVFPLELVHEHRNYFATIGFFIAVAWSLQRVRDRWRQIAFVAMAAYLVLLSGVTLTRSLQWSNDVDLALLEASNHPRSSRANYQLGRIYLALLETTGEQRFGPLAEQALHHAADGYLPGLGPFFGLVHLAYYRNGVPDPAIVVMLKDRLRDGPFYNANTSFLNSFFLCQIDNRCRMPDVEAEKIFLAALANPRIPPDKKAEVYKILAQYYINRLHDFDKGGELIAAAVETHDISATRIMYAQVFGLRGRYADAREQLDRAEALDKFAVYKGRIERERAALRKAEAP